MSDRIPPSLSLGEDGAQLIAGGVKDDLPALLRLTASLPADVAGLRLQNDSTLRSLLVADGAIGVIASNFLDERCSAVRAIMFDKSPRANWSLGWHQDRTICVRRRIATNGFGPWTVKAATHHVEPPIDILSKMLTLRVHLDDVPDTNAPLMIAPKSHRLGRVPVAAIEATVARCGVFRCLAVAGDVWAYSTPILHASEAARLPVHRRVLQIDFAAVDLPNGLEWAGV